MFTAESKAGLVLPRLGRIFPFALIFLYFLFSSGELLHIVVSIFKPKITQLVALLIVGYFCLFVRRLVLPRAILYPAVWILFSLAISAFFSAHPLRSGVYVGLYLFNFIFYFLIPLNLFQVFEPAKILKVYFLAFSCIGLYAVLQITLSLFGIYDPLATQRVGSLARGQAWTYEPSYYALYITAYVMFKNGLAIFRSNLSFPRREILKLLGVNCLLLASTSTGIVFTYPAFCLASLGMSFFRPFQYARKRIYQFIGLSCALAGVLSWFFWDLFVLSFYKFFYFGFLDHHSFAARWEGVVSCLKVFFENLFLGVGVGGVGPYLFSQNSFYDKNPATLVEVESYDPTNVFTEVLASLGIVGLVGFAALVFVFYRCFRQVIATPQISNQDKTVATALFISLVILIFVLQYNQGLFRPYIWIHAGIVYGYLHRLQTTDDLS